MSETFHYGSFDPKTKSITCAHGHMVRWEDGNIGPVPRCGCLMAFGRVPMSQWGKDHFSTLGYIECRIVDNKGTIDPRHLRCNKSANGHRQANRVFGADMENREYPTRLRGGTHLYGHDDWSCIDDIVAERLLEWNGTGLHPVFALTERGHTVCAALRKHKAQSGSFGTFVPPEAVL